MSRIRCFMLRDAGRTVTEGIVTETVFVADDGREFVLGSGCAGIPQAPPGAMWDAPWYLDLPRCRPGSDGVLLVVRTPVGDWIVDGPSDRGVHWVRTGTLPDVTVTPSILQTSYRGGYHGWLRDGWLEEC